MESRRRDLRLNGDAVGGSTKTGRALGLQVALTPKRAAVDPLIEHVNFK